MSANEYKYMQMTQSLWSTTCCTSLRQHLLPPGVSSYWEAIDGYIDGSMDVNIHADVDVIFSQAWDEPLG